MQRRKQQLRPYFNVGNKVQLKPGQGLKGSYLEGLRGTIIKIDQRPDPQFFDVQTQEDLEDYLRIRSVHFWIKLDDFPELDDYYKQHEILCRYSELRPLPLKMNKQQLVQYCKSRMLKEKSEDRQWAYSEMAQYLSDTYTAWPLSSYEFSVPQGYYVDLINSFINKATRIRELIQGIQEKDTMNEITVKYELLAQVCDEMTQRLIPEMKQFAIPV